MSRTDGTRAARPRLAQRFLQRWTFHEALFHSKLRADSMVRRRPKSDPPAAASARSSRWGRERPHPPALSERSYPRGPRKARAPAERGRFFDAGDAVQVKYEMLRLHRVEGLSVTEVAARFGVSRQTFYTIARAFDARGLVGLLPGGWKCTDEVIAFVERRLAQDPGIALARLVGEINRRFRVLLHPNTIRYALAKRDERPSRRAS
jgi:transposase